jgi:8-oxo-dGTP pyrophosphatase MutT (NUDIX family)
MTFAPIRRTTLCFIFNDREEVLMILKKRGMGAGKWNFPGGKIQPGEDAVVAAQRETYEETGLQPEALEECGTLEFLFPEGAAASGNQSWSNVCRVFRTARYAGQLLAESEESTNAWVPVKEIPFDKMWPDDRRWVPLLLAGRPFHRVYRFNAADELLAEEVRL